MGLLNHLIPPKGKVWISFDKPTFAEGEAVVGKVNVDAQEYIQGKGIVLEARVFESWEEMEWVTVGNQRIQQPVRRNNTLFSRDVQVTGPSDFGKGNVQTFPFSVGIPVCHATRGGAAVENSLKAVLQINGRPHLTTQTQVAFGPPTAQMPAQPGYMPTGYPMPQGYGAPGYGPPQPGYGYNPNPAYGPPMPGYGQPMPQGYGPSPQQQQQQQQPTGPQVRCKYCTGLMNANATNCPNCGAHQ